MKLESVKEVRRRDDRRKRQRPYVIWTSLHICLCDFGRVIDISPERAMAWHDKNKSKKVYKKMNTKSFIFEYRNAADDFQLSSISILPKLPFPFKIIKP